VGPQSAVKPPYGHAPSPHGVRWRWRRARVWSGSFAICGLVLSLISLLDILFFEHILCDSPPLNMSGVWAGFCGRSSWWPIGSTVARRPVAWICERVAGVQDDA